MAEAQQAVHAGEPARGAGWEKTFERWRGSQSMREFFPQAGDAYIDGGAIDNTPSNSAIDATREWAERESISKRDLALDLYIVFLHPEPAIDPADVRDQAFHQVLQRTLAIQGAAKQTNDAVIVDTVNTFGQRGERLGDTLLVVLESYQKALESLDEEQKDAALNQVRQRAKEQQLRGYLGRSSEGILERIEGWAENIVSNRLPLHIDAVKIYPEEMPLSTLQFTERLGYRQDNALAMLTMGCHNTLWTLREHLEGQGSSLDAQDKQTLSLARKWMGSEPWPQGHKEQENLRQTWRCQRTACVFHAQHCRRGLTGAEKQEAT